MKLVVATKNQHKVQEISAILQDLPNYKLVSLNEYPKAPEVIEDQATFVGNASKKALETAQFTGELAMADDSGLEVAALHGAPGVFSARYAGAGASYQQLCEKLLKEMQHIPPEKRKAQFKTVIAVATPQKVLFTVEGVCPGIIINEMRGTQGFGYDPVFLYEPLNKTFAELTMTEKNQVSHRSRALQKLKEKLKKELKKKL